MDSGVKMREKLPKANPTMVETVQGACQGNRRDDDPACDEAQGGLGCASSALLSPSFFVVCRVFLKSVPRALFMYAVIKTGGKQYRVTPGEKIKVEQLPADIGSQ